MFNDKLSVSAQGQLQRRLTRPNKQRPNEPIHGANDEMEGLMDNPVVDISRDIFRLEADIRKLTIRVDKRLITKNIQDSLSQFRKNFELYFESFKTPEKVDAIITAGANTATYGESVGHILNRFSSLGFENRRLAQQIIQKSRSINNSLATKRELFIRGLRNYKESDLPKLERNMQIPEMEEQKVAAQGGGFSPHRYARTTASAAPAASPTSKQKPPQTPASKTATTEPKESALTYSDHVLKEQLEKSRRQIKQLMVHAKKAEEAYNQSHKKMQQLRRASISQLNQSKAEIEALKSDIASSASAKSFEFHAEEEKGHADFFRYATFGYMGFFLLLVGYLLIETATASFDIARTSMRTLLILSLLIPCGYVARESSNHRKQQHRYMRDALKQRTSATNSELTSSGTQKSFRDEVLSADIVAKQKGTRTS